MRAAQLAALNRYVPFNVALMMVNVLMLANVLGDHPRRDFLSVWATVLGGLSVLWIVRFRRTEKQGATEQASAFHFWLVTAEVLTFGVLWAAMSVVMAAEAGDAGQGLILLLSIVAMGASGFAAATMPVCGIATISLIGLGIMVALPADSLVWTAPVVVALATYWLVIVRGVLVTTSALMARMKALGMLGVHFALDDFGTGYSAMGYLQKAAFSRIKIDRSFVSRAGKGTEASAIIEAIVHLAHSLGMTTTAEGTETRAEVDICRELGCEQMQGYFFGRPMPPEKATALVCEARQAAE